MYVGVDEAGRGPVLGPLVVAGVRGRPADVPAGVTDSKRLTPAQRETAYEAICASSGLTRALVVVEAATLNQRMAAGTSLNVIETDAFVSVLDQLAAPRAVVDTITSRPDRFARTLVDRLGGRCKVEARVKADASDPLVGAASIVAKVTRDRAITEIATALDEPIGSGYASDPLTRAFLTRWRAAHRDPPPHARTAWATITRLGFGSASLLDFEPSPGGSQ